jgi:PII-like signaling protein
VESLSCDLPLIAVAVDRRDRIEAMLPALRSATAGGVVTLEAARLTDLEGDPPATDGEDLKLTVYCGRSERVDGRSTARAVVEHARANGAAAATVLLGLDGTVHGRRRRGRFLSRNRDVPVMIEIVGSAAPLITALPGLRRLLVDPVVTLERVSVGGDGVVADAGGQAWHKLTVHCGAEAMVGDRPLHLALLELVQSQGIAGATSLRGVWGFSGADAPHGDSARSLRRRTPMVTVALDHRQAIERVLPAVCALVGSTGVVSREWVPVVERPETSPAG